MDSSKVKDLLIEMYKVINEQADKLYKAGVDLENEEIKQAVDKIKYILIDHTVNAVSELSIDSDSDSHRNALRRLYE